MRSLSTGLTAGNSVSVDKTREEGQITVDSMTGKAVSDFKSKKQDQVVTLTNKDKVTSETEPIPFDSTLLFQRLVKIAESSPETVPSAFEYELTNIPTSLFEPSGLSSLAKKHLPANYLWSAANHLSSKLPEDAYFVLDRGDLLHRLA